MLIPLGNSLLLTEKCVCVRGTDWKLMTPHLSSVTLRQWEPNLLAHSLRWQLTSQWTLKQLGNDTPHHICAPPHPHLAPIKPSLCAYFVLRPSWSFTSLWQVHFNCKTNRIPTVNGKKWKQTEMCGNVENMSLGRLAEPGLKGKHLFFTWFEGKIWGEQ